MHGQQKHGTQNWYSVVNLRRKNTANIESVSHFQNNKTCRQITPFITTCPSLRSPGSNRCRTLLHVLVSKLSNPVTSLRSLHWLKITERIKYKLLSLTYKVLTTTQPSYLHNLITVQPPRSTLSSSLVTLARTSTSSSRRITDPSFQYASHRLWNQLPASLRQPRTNLSNSDSLSSLNGTSSIGSIN